MRYFLSIKNLVINQVFTHPNVLDNYLKVSVNSLANRKKQSYTHYDPRKTQQNIRI